MVKLVVLYGQPTDPAAFDTYYAETHVPLVAKIPDLQQFEYGKALGTPTGGQTPYYFMAELWFESVQQLQASMGSEAGRAAGQDTAAFATGGVTMFIADAQR